MRFFDQLLFSLCLLLTSCLTPIDLQAPAGSTSQLVVEGSFSQLFFPEVRLSLTSDLSGVNNDFTPVDDAEVTIAVSDGNSYSLSAMQAGLYQWTDSSFPLEAGLSYTLNITLSDGRSYQSNPQELPSEVAITNGEAEFTEETFTNASGATEIRKGHDLFLTLEKKQDQFFLVETLGYAQVFIGYNDCGVGPDAPVPAGLTTCYQQRLPIDPNTLTIGTTQSVSETLRFEAVRVPFDIRGEYAAIIYVQAMDAANYSYWLDVQGQLNRPGGLFDRPFAPIEGNIIPINHDQSALGYFHAYRTSSEIICFDRTNIPGTFELPIIECPDLCTNFWAPATFQDLIDILCNP